MLWLRKGIVHILAVLLLVSLLGLAGAIAFTRNLAQPTKLEGWIAESHLYDHVVDETLSRIKVGDAGVTGASIAYTNPQIKKAANQAFSPQFIQQSVNTFVEANYAWLQGKTKTPDFTIDLRIPKQNFAKIIGQQVQSRLAALPECSTTQLAGFQFPVDSLAVECRPPALDPQAEATRATKELTNSDAFIKNSVITASVIGNDNQSQPYYKELVKAPEYYHLSTYVPWILSVIILIAALGIFFIAPTRRQGLRRIAWMTLDAGVILVTLKFVLDSVVKFADRHALNSASNGELSAPLSTIVQKAATGIIHVGYYCGIACIIVAVLLFTYLIVTFKRKSKTGTTDQATAQPEQVTEPGPTEPDFSEAKPALDATKVQLAPSRRQPAMDIMMPRKKKSKTVAVTPESIKQSPKSRRGLIQ